MKKGKICTNREAIEVKWGREQQILALCGRGKKSHGGGAGINIDACRTVRNI